MRLVARVYIDGVLMMSLGGYGLMGSSWTFGVVFKGFVTFLGVTGFMYGGVIIVNWGYRYERIFLKIRKMIRMIRMIMLIMITERRELLQPWPRTF